MSFKSAFTPHSLWRLRRLSCRRQHSVPAGEGGAADARRGVGGEGCAAAALRWAAANAQRCHLVMRDAFAGSVLRRGTRKLRHMLSRCDRVPVCCPESAQRVNDIDPFGLRRELVQRAYSATGWRQEPSDAAVGLCTADFFFPGCTRRHDFDPGRAKRAQRALCCRQRVPG